MRYDAFTTRGLKRVRGPADQIEGGLYDLDQAESIRPLSGVLEGERRVAAAYQNALYYVGADWDRAIFLLSQLPQGYRDVSRRLLNAYVDAGDAFAELEDWCPAEKKFADALKVANTARIDAKRADAAQKCVIATPAPGSLTGTLSAGAPISLKAYAASGVAGRIAFSVYDVATGQYRPYAWDAASASVIALDSEIPDEGLYSPDRARYVQSTFQDGQWRITLHSGTESAPLTQGQRPVWGPSGLIAYQGCSDQCGIHVIDPNAPGSPPRRLTASSNDIAFKWSPQGDRLAYMSNYNGSYEIYTVGLNGDFRQLTGWGVSTGAPVWSPDGTQIALLSNRDGAFALFVINADGSNPQKLADFDAVTPGWQSDRVAWAR